ncbi:MAG: sulfatase-like hydrolase/transferase [Candidatus Aminicenantia bacterium]
MKFKIFSFLFIILISFFSDCGKEELIIKRNPFILISIDTLRSDHLSCYGYKGVKTENILSFSKDSVLFENVVSPAPLTLPSHISMLSGMYPFEHGVRDNIGFSLSKDIKTLPLLFKEIGYKTGGVVSAFVLRKETGISNGFDFYDDKTEGKTGKLSMGEVQRDGSQSVKIAMNWINSLKEENFSLFLHLYEPHTPYEPPEPYKSLYRENLYDGEIAYVDSILGDFFDFLKKKGLYRKSLIILTADHGEGLGEHGEREHGIFLYNSTISIPLLIKFPYESYKGKRIKESVSLIDICPTVSELYSLKYKSIHGISLLKLFNNSIKNENRFLYSETLYPRYHFGWSELRSVRFGNYKLIISTKPEMFDLKNDPKEERNIFSKEDELAKYLSSSLSSILKNEIPTDPKNVDSETMEKLQALGYVGVSKLDFENKESLPDPKDRHYLLKYLGKATYLSRIGKDDSAIQAFKYILEKDRNIIDVWTLMARSYTKLKKYKEAIDAYKEALKLNPQNPVIIFHIAKLYDTIGDWKKAIENIELALKLDPQMERCYALKSKIYFYRNDFVRATEFADIALSKNPELPLPYYIKGLLKLRQGDKVSAEKYFELASKYEEEGSFHSLHFNLGLFRYKRGDLMGAMEEYEKELKYYPDNYMARTNLALLQRKFGFIKEALKNFELLINDWKSSQPYIFLAETYGGIGEIEKAKFWASKGLESFPNDKNLNEIIRKIESIEKKFKK